MRLHCACDTRAEKLGDLFVFLLVYGGVNTLCQQTERADDHAGVTYGVPVVGLRLESPARALLGARDVTAVEYHGVVAVMQALLVNARFDDIRVEFKLLPHVVEPVVYSCEIACGTRAVKEVTGAPVLSVDDCECAVVSNERIGFIVSELIS